jgi:phosphoribosylaminoimidazole carboxylase (NCAIR synthetase)
MNSQFSGNKFRLGVLGGGQLGRMLIQEAINLNISIIFISLHHINDFIPITTF